MAGRRRNVNIGANSIVYSGRGRPRKEVAEATAAALSNSTNNNGYDRPLPANIVLGSPSSPGMADLYKNRKIRVGGPFQAKVPKYNPGGNSNSTEGGGGEEDDEAYVSRRPPPFRVSQSHPHLTEDEVKEYKQSVVEERQQRLESSVDHLAAATEGGSVAATDVDATTKISQAIGVRSVSPNNNNTSTGSLTSNISGSLKTATTDRQQEDDDMNDQDDDDDEMEDAFPTERGGLLLCPADPSASAPSSSNASTADNSNIVNTRRRNSNTASSQTTEAAKQSVTSAEDDFWGFAQPLLLPRGTTVNINSSCNQSQAWQSQMLQWNLDKQQRQQQAAQKVEEELAQQPKKRGRKKRKKEVPGEEALDINEEDPIEWYAINIMGVEIATKESDASPDAQQAPKRQRVITNSIATTTGNNNIDYLQGTHEERLQAMQYLWLRHKRHSAAAKLETIVQLSAGNAELIRRVRQHKRRKQRKPDITHRYSWRQHCEESNIKAMTGDFRDPKSDASTKYAFPAKMLPNNRNKGVDKGFDGHYEQEVDVEVQKEIWKSILAFGRAIEENLDAVNNSSSSRNLPKLSLLLSFLNNAYHVRPIPEDIFRAPSVPPEINTCLNNIMEYVDAARKKQAELIDVLYDTYHGGVDLEALQKLLDQTGRALSVELDDAKELRRQVGMCVDWQKRLDDLVGDNELCLNELEELALEGHSFAFRTKSLVQLESRIHKAHLLRERIETWKKSCTQDEEDLEDRKESIRFLGAMVRDANRLKLVFPEVSELLETHRSVETWIDRASIAVRSRISLTEIKTLVETGEGMPVDLSDLLEKLQARVSMAEEWIAHFKEVVPCPEPLPTANTQPSDNTSLRWMAQMRDSLVEGKHSALHDFASEGSRIPVDVDIVKLLQIQLDAKNWTMKARKWIPSLSLDDSSACKRGKLEDLREHLEKASQLREKLVLPAPVRSEWVLEGEKDMRAIVEAADAWFQNYKPYLDWDNRRSEGRSCLSLEKLRTIVAEASSIHANIGSASGKMSRILTQAEEWAEKYETLLVRCNIVKKEGADQQPFFYATLPQMTAAAEAAASGVSLDLDEAKELEKLVVSVKGWSDRVANAAPKRSKRQGRGKKAKITVDEIIELIKEASDLPVDTSDDVNRLQIQLSEVQEWRAKARQELEEILNGFQKLRLVVDDMYGPPSEYSRNNNDEKSDTSDDEDGSNKANRKDGNSSREEKKSAEGVRECETSSTAGSDHDSESLTRLGSGQCNVNQLIKNYNKEAKSFGVLSGEVEAGDQLERISTWCVRSLKYLITQRDIFDKRYFGAFDRFLAEGKSLTATPEADSTKARISLDDTAFEEKLNSTWGAFVFDQLRRLEVLIADRERFMLWCDSADAALFSAKDKRPGLDVLKDIADKSRDFPSVCDMVQKVRGLYNKTIEWKELTRKLLQEDSEKLTLYEAKGVLEDGEKLGFVCDELKDLRHAHRAARIWANRVKKLDIEEGATNANEVQDLIDEHDDLLLELPDELERLQEAMKGYCICRRAYSGFMIGCDECEEWYHGSCIGISESRADRFDKYACIRCCITKSFKNTAKDAVSVVRKWTCPKDMKKARQVEAQKHQRKVRKETKDIEKLQGEIRALEESQADKEKLQGDLQSLEASQAQPASEAVANGDPGSGPDATMIDTAGSAPVEVSVDVTTGDNGANAQAESSAIVAESSAPFGAQFSNTLPEVEKAALGETPGVNKGEEENKVAEEKLPASVHLSPEQLQEKIDKAQSKIKQCTERLSVLSKRGEERKALLKQEDANAPLLRLWCLRVRTLVLVPRSDDGAKQSQPLDNGSLSWAMEKAIEEARKLNISELPDVTVLVNSFRCMCWCILATEYLGRKPTFDEIDLLVSRAKDVSFPEEKALRMMKGMHGRAKSWKIKVIKELAPVAGEKKCYNVSTLKELRTASEEIPMRMKEEALLTGVIEDEGARHCICGGPSDARFMLSCDKCQKWYHGPCVKMTKEKCDGVEKWICPHCSGSFSDIDHEARTIVLEDLKKRSKPNMSPEAPDPSKMWPPFGLFNSQSALEILGEKCSALPDVNESDIDARVVQLTGQESNSDWGQPEAEANNKYTNGAVTHLSTKDAPGTNGASFDTDNQPLSSATVTHPLQQAAEPGHVQFDELSRLNTVESADTIPQETFKDPDHVGVNAPGEVREVPSAGDQPLAMNVENCDKGDNSKIKDISENAIAEEKQELLSAMEIEPSHPENESETTPAAMEIEHNDQEEKEGVAPVRESQHDQQPTLFAPVASGLTSSHISEGNHSASLIPPTVEMNGSTEDPGMPFAVVSESNADTGTTHSSSSPPATLLSAEVPLAVEETASNVKVLEMSQNGVSDTSVAERSAPPQNTEAMNIDSEAPPSLNCDSGEASTIQSDDIRLSPSAQLNGGTMNVMVPALPVQDSGN